MIPTETATGTGTRTDTGLVTGTRTDTGLVTGTGAGTDTEQPALSESQRSLLVIDRLIPVEHLYNGVFELELTPGHSPEQLRRALAEVVAVQPALRQRFGLVPEPHTFLGAPPAPADLAYEHIADTGAATLSATVGRLGGQSWDIERGPLYRFVYLHSAERSVLLFVVHHLVFDAVSAGPFVRDLQTALAGGFTPTALDELRVRRERELVRECAAQARLAAEPATAELARDWARELADRPALVVNPRPQRPVETSFTGARAEWQLGPAESAAAAAICRQLGISAYELFLSVYGAVLARHAATESVVIGSPFMSRRTVGSFDLCGFFVNTLPVAFDVDWRQSFADYACDVVRPAAGTARSRIRVAFNQIVEHARPDRTSDRNPVFSCMLAMQDELTPAPGGAVTAVREHGNGTAKFDLWLGVTPVQDRWRLELEYDTELLPEPVAQAVIDSLRTALARATADPGRPLADLFVDASLAESAKDDGHRAPAGAATLIDWVRRTAAERPDAVALSSTAGDLTYRELAYRTRRTAAALRRHGVGPGDVVGVAADDFTDTIVTILGLLAAGAAYLPYDTDLPAERIRYMLRQAGSTLAIGDPIGDPTGGLIGDPDDAIDGGEDGQNDVRTLTPAQLTHTPVGHDTPDDTATANAAARPAEPAGDRAVYVMFSSGSTGRPKGIEMTEGALLNLTAWQIDALGMGGDTRFVQYAPLGFDVSFQELLPTLAAGGTVISREPADRRDFPALVRRLEESRATHLYLPVAALRTFVQAAGDADVPFPALRQVCVSGEQLMLDDDIRAFFRVRPHLQLINLYGPTETHAVTTHRLTGDTDWPDHVPIGVPLSGVRAYVVDTTGHLAPPGVQGELYLGGACPARGYRNAPELTARAFHPDPYADGDGRMYRTGDQVLRDEHGTLLFLGRGDDQVKIRGYRVELGELETVAHAAPGVAQAVAAVRDTGTGTGTGIGTGTGTVSDRALVLFVRPETPGAPDEPQLRDLLAQRLPDYMLPRWILPVATIPVTANGKVDRAALLRDAETAIARQQAEADHTPASYEDALEEELAAMWGELLGTTAPLHRDTSLLEQGAHSLMVLTALSRIRQRHGAEIPMRKFFQTPTIAALAAAVRAGQAQR
ncbi:amino acid adenylation domain-containing protein [Streptomyces monticola]|uniref:Amino acid adenylation domain-containing protein n=1 Tax=Streptomyces monticola TaxID=2666263 RepID=A0ABW2JSY2_9ACTN